MGRRRRAANCLLPATRGPVVSDRGGGTTAGETRRGRRQRTALGQFVDQRAPSLDRLRRATVNLQPGRASPNAPRAGAPGSRAGQVRVVQDAAEARAPGRDARCRGSPPAAHRAAESRPPPAAGRRRRPGAGGTRRTGLERIRHRRESPAVHVEPFEGLPRGSSLAADRCSSGVIASTRPSRAVVRKPMRSRRSGGSCRTPP